MRFLRLIVTFLYHVTDQLQRVYWQYYKNGLDCRGTALLGLDIRDVAYINTALYSRTFHERGTCDRRSDFVLWRAWHTPESIVFHLHCYSCSVLYPLSCTDIYFYILFQILVVWNTTLRRGWSLTVWPMVTHRGSTVIINGARSFYST